MIFTLLELQEYQEVLSLKLLLQLKQLLLKPKKINQSKPPQLITKTSLNPLSRKILKKILNHLRKTRRKRLLKPQKSNQLHLNQLRLVKKRRFNQRHHLQKKNRRRLMIKMMKIHFKPFNTQLMPLMTISKKLQLKKRLRLKRTPRKVIAATMKKMKSISLNKKRRVTKTKN